MRLAFVGKGGSGKSTVAASFSSYLTQATKSPVVVFDADINIHAPELLGFGQIPFEKHLSNPKVSNEIRKWLIGKNSITDLNVFRKTTPPTRLSNLIDIENIDATPLKNYGYSKNNLTVFAVGTYQEEEIGASCYHNNLATLENIISHTDDKNGYIVVDMVAGVDSFASTLHAQFDMVCFILEPTKRSLEVFKTFDKLAISAGTHSNLYVTGNKIRSQKDIDFIKENTSDTNYLGSFYDDDHIRDIDQNDSMLDYSGLLPKNQTLLSHVKQVADSMPDYRNDRLGKIWQLHKKYVAQGFIKERFGDLSNQIDTDFKFE